MEAAIGFIVPARPAGGNPLRTAANQPTVVPYDGLGHPGREEITVFVKQNLFALGFIAAPALAAATLQAAVVPFTEDYAVDTANWKDAVSTDPVHVASGGPDGSAYISTLFSFENSADGDTPVLLRGQDGFDASADAFVGDWIADGVTTFTAWVRHSAGVPLNYFTRFASPVNFPGATAVSFVPVLPDTWTRITFDISAVNPQFVTFEGSDFATSFGNIGNVQIGVSVPAALTGYVPDVTFDLDKPTITPEPTALGLLTLGTLWMLRRRDHA